MGKGAISKALIGWSLFAVIAFRALPQEAGPDSETGPATVAVSPTPVLERPATMKGDIVTLKSGAVIKGGQVVRGATMDLLVEFVGGAVTLRIPRKHVASVVYDDVNPVRDRRRRQALLRKQSKFTVIQGQKVSDELRTKLLATDVADSPLKYEEEDLVDVLKSLSERFDVPIFIGEPVMAIPPEERKWTFQAKPETNLSSLLSDELLKDFDNLQVVYQYDKVLVTTREAARPPESEREPVPAGGFSSVT